MHACGLQLSMMWNITGTRIHMANRGSEPWAQGSLIPGSNYSAQVGACLAAPSMLSVTGRVSTWIVANSSERATLKGGMLMSYQCASK